MSFNDYNDYSLCLKPLKLRRSYKAICINCNQISESYDSSIKEVLCYFCSVIKIQNIIRKYLAHKRYKNLLIDKELLYRYFFKQKNIKGIGLVENICKYL